MSAQSHAAEPLDRVFVGDISYVRADVAVGQVMAEQKVTRSLLAALARIRDEYGLNHTSGFARDLSAAAIAKATGVSDSPEAG